MFGLPGFRGIITIGVLAERAGLLPKLAGLLPELTGRLLWYLFLCLCICIGEGAGESFMRFLLDLSDCFRRLCFKSCRLGRCLSYRGLSRFLRLSPRICRKLRSGWNVRPELQFRFVVIKNTSASVFHGKCSFP